MTGTCFLDDPKLKIFVFNFGHKSKSFEVESNSDVSSDDRSLNEKKITIQEQ